MLYKYPIIFFIIICPKVLRSPKVLDIIYFVDKLSGGWGLDIGRWREGADEGDKIESIDGQIGHWEALKQKCCFSHVPTDGRHSAANIIILVQFLFRTFVHKMII